MNLNKVYLIGRLTQDPENRTTASGQQVCTFGLATNRVFMNQTTKEKQEKAEFHNIVLWGRLAEIASKYLAKGRIAMIEGRIQTRSWQDNSGNKRYKTEIVAENLQMGPRPSGEGQSFQPKSGNTPGKQQQFQKPAQEEIPIIEEGKDEEIDVRDIPF